MLIARKSNGDFISLGKSELHKESLIELRKKERYYCPACKQEVILKLGDQQAWHFSHKPGLNCSEEIEGETQYHIEGKKLLYDWFLRQGYSVQLEPYIRAIKQRPDLLVSIPNGDYAIEFQCAKISSNLFLKRSSTYENNGFTPIWILGGNQIKRNSKYLFSLSSFHWLFTYSNYSLSKLISFCPNSQSFLILSSITPFSVNRAFLNQTYLPLATTNFEELLSEKKNIVPNEQWFQKKKAWREFKLRLSHPEVFMYKFYYQRNVSIYLFPSEAGIPSPDYFKIETPSYLWQSWLLEMFIINKEPGDKIPLKLVYRGIDNLIARNIFHVRETPLIKRSNVYTAIQNYLIILCQLNILSTNDRELFVIKTKIKRPTNIQDALKRDWEVMVQMKQLL